MKTVQKIAILCSALLVTVCQLYLSSSNLNSAPFRRFAVIGCSTPDRRSHRGFDYAFYLPLTVWAWRRIGFESVVLIIGKRQQWASSPILSVVLERLEQLQTVVLFVNAPATNRGMLSQTARLFVFNMDGFPGQENDYLISSDADLWPLRLEHFAPRTDSDLVLVHSDCCGRFRFKNRSYQMIPMSHVGARVATWKQIMNDGHTFANDTATILKYLEGKFGPKVRQRVQYASRQWYYDQLMVSIRISEWIERYTNESVHRVSDGGFERVDRVDWHPEWLNAESFKLQYDVHLPLELYLPENWASIQPLITLMYEDDDRIRWFDDYALRFSQQINQSKFSSAIKLWWN